MLIKFSKDKLLRWLGSDLEESIDKEAELMKNIPLKATTLARIKSGSYVPSERLGNSIMKFISEN